MDDLNAKSTIWTTRTDRRGAHIEESIVGKHHLVCMNNFNVPTFERRGITSTLDITLVSLKTAPLITWKILPNETLSDHRALFYVISSRNRQTRNTQDRTQHAQDGT